MATGESKRAFGRPVRPISRKTARCRGRAEFRSARPPSRDGGAGRALHHQLEAERRRADGLAEANEIFRSVLENSLDAAYRRNLVTDRYDYLSPVFEEITGLPLVEMEGDLGRVLGRVHPDDLPALEHDITVTHDAALLAGRASATVEYRFRVKGGEYRWLADHFTVLAEDGRLVYRLGIVRDVTERRLLLARTEHEREFREGLLQAVPAGIVVFDGRDLRARWANASYREFLEEPHRSMDIVGLRIEQFVPRAVEQGVPDIFRRVIETGEPHFDPEYRHEGFARGTTYWRWALLPIAPAVQFAGRRDLLLVAIEVTEQVQTRRQLESLLADVERSRLAAEEQSALLRQQADVLTLTSDALEVERARLAAVIDQMPVGVILAKAPEGELVLANRQVAEIWRHPFLAAKDISGYSVYSGFHADGRRYDPEEWPLARALTMGEVVNGEEIEFLRGDGSWAVMSVSAAPVRNREGRITAAVASFADITERKRAEVTQREVAMLEERQRIARELHDSVSQALYGIGLAARTALELLSRKPEQARPALEYTLNLAQSGLTEMRALIFELRPELLATEGLIRALNKQTEALQQRREVMVDASLCEEPDIPLPAKEALYRIAQEAVNNASKHANAHVIRIHLSCEAASVTLEVEDDGRGFDPTADFPGHMGLRSMRERAEQVGARFSLESTMGAGTRIRVSYPQGERSGS